MLDLRNAASAAARTHDVRLFRWYPFSTVRFLLDVETSRGSGELGWDTPDVVSLTSTHDCSF